VFCPTCVTKFEAASEKDNLRGYKFIIGNPCPACSDMCCCSKTRVGSCQKSFHCYRRCKIFTGSETNFINKSKRKRGISADNGEVTENGAGAGSGSGLGPIYTPPMTSPVGTQEGYMASLSPLQVNLEGLWMLSLYIVVISVGFEWCIGKPSSSYLLLSHPTVALASQITIILTFPLQPPPSYSSWPTQPSCMSFTVESVKWTRCLFDQF